MTNYQPYEDTSPAIKVSKGQNENNIVYLKDNFDLINTKITDMEGNITTLQSQMKSIADAQAKSASTITNGNQPIKIDTNGM
jgi:prefoldin subunit 5